jgi:hypothetical protein
MAKFFSTTFGAISGRHGSAVAATSKDGQSILRVYRAPSNPRTEKQMDHRARFGNINSELSNYQSLFKRTFKTAVGRNYAVSFALNNAVLGEYPNYSVDYSKLQIATGRIDTPSHISAAITTGSKVKFDWDGSIDGSESSTGDFINLAFINSDQKVAILKEEIVLRTAATTQFELPLAWAGNQIHCWAYFTNQYGTATSNSIYLGLLDF